MTLNELTIRGFGKFHDRTFTFSDGINILYGKNESGKSTLHSFLRAMLFGMERARGGPRRRISSLILSPGSGTAPMAAR